MAERNRIVLSGPLAGPEVWSTSLQFGGTSGGTVVSTQDGLAEWGDTLALDFAETWQDWVTLRSGVSSGGSLNKITLQYYGPGNLLTAQHEEILTAPLGGLNALSKPLPTAMVASIRTGQPGASRRGRVYWPALAINIGTDGRFSSATALSMCNEWAALAKVCADATPGPDPSIYCVYSPTLDVLTPVTSVQAGRVPDTQRRRRDALQEEYSSVGYPLGG